MLDHPTRKSIFNLADVANHFVDRKETNIRHFFHNYS